MAKKKAVTTTQTPTGDIENAGNVVLLPLSRVTRNAAIAAREGEPDQDKIMRFAENFIERKTQGQPHQLSPALVRTSDSETFELIDGVHRFEACKAATSAAGEEFMLLARVVDADDEHGLIDAIQSNEFREDPNDFDRAGAIEKLITLGKTQAECAVIFGLSEGSISQIRKVGSLPSKYRKAIENGDIDRDAAIFIAGLEGDETTRNEVFEKCLKHKEYFTNLEVRIEGKRQRALAEEKLQDAKQAKEEAQEEAKAKGDERKALEKSVKELEASTSKTKDVDELISIRDKQKKLKEEAEALAKAEKEALALAEKAAKAVEKAKLEKEKVKESAAAKKAVTQEDAKSVAKNMGAKTKGGKDIKAPKTKNQFYAEITAIGEDENNPVPEAVGALIGKIQGFLDGDDTSVQLRNALLACCKTDEQWEAAKVAKKRR